MGKRAFLQIPSQDRLQELFDYTEDGNLVWRVAKGYIKPGTVAGTVRPNGYLQIAVDRKIYKAHRLVWGWHHANVDPLLEIDHINGIPADNRIENLRTATRTTNVENRHGAQKNNRCGRLGVMELPNGKFIASVIVGRKRFHVGTFEDVQSAYSAYIERKRLLHKGNTL